MPSQYSTRTPSPEPFDCSDRTHAVDGQGNRDICWSQSAGTWLTCDNQPCPNRERFGTIDRIDNDRYYPVEPLVASLPETTESQHTETTPIQVDPVTVEPAASATHSPIEVDTESIHSHESSYTTMSNTQPPPNATTQDIQNFIATLANNQTNLQTTLQTLVNNLTLSKKAGKPHDYDGTRGEDAQRFMAALELYFKHHDILNTADVTQ